VPPNQDTILAADIPFFYDNTSYIGDSSLAGKQVATPTTLDNPNLVLRYTVTRSGKYSLGLSGVSSTRDTTVMASPFDLTIFPSIACASTSTAAGTSLSLATAGIAATFTVQSRDMYWNVRGTFAGDNFVARVRQFYGSGASNLECSATNVCDPSWQTYSNGWVSATPLTFDWKTRARGWVPWRDKPAQVLDNGDSTYTVSYNTTRSATNYIWVSLAVAGGLQATYYTSTEANDYISDGLFRASAANRFVQQDSTIDFSVTSVAPVPIADKRIWAVCTRA
jgi:hypothetical protein